MNSKNKPKPTKTELAHIRRLAEMHCVVCGTYGPSEVHEIKQGQWFSAIPLCTDCHRGSLNGIHGQRNMWRVMRMDELDALAKTVEALCVA